MTSVLKTRWVTFALLVVCQSRQPDLHFLHAYPGTQDTMIDVIVSWSLTHGIRRRHRDTSAMHWLHNQLTVDDAVLSVN